MGLTFKKMVSLVIIGLLALSFMSFVAFADTATSGAVSDTITWSYDAGTTTLTLSGNGEVPATCPWDTYKSSITTLVIGEGITSVAKAGFSEHTALKSIEFPENEFIIGMNAFSGCTALETVTIPGSVNTIGGRAFFNCTSLESVVMEEGVDYIGSQAFSSCTSLKRVTIPKSAQISTAAQQARKGADGNIFHSTNFNDLIVTVSEDVIDTDSDWVNGYTYVQKFPGTTNIYNIVDTSNDPANHMTLAGNKILKYEVYGENVGHGYDQSVEWEYDGTTKVLTLSGKGSLTNYVSGDAQPWSYCSEKIEKLVIQEGITAISKNSFTGLTALKSIQFPASLVEIGMNAFSNCTALEEVYIPSTVKVIGVRAFRGCTGLKRAEVLGGNNYTGGQLFGGCSSLEIVELGPDVKIDRTNINGQQDGTMFRGITDFSKLIVYVHPNSDAYTYVNADIYKINEKTENDVTGTGTNYMTSGGYILNYIVLDHIEMRYNEDTKTVTVSSNEERTADLIFASYDKHNEELLSVEIQQDVVLEIGAKQFVAKSFEQSAGTITKIFLWNDMNSLVPVCDSLSRERYPFRD